MRVLSRLTAQVLMVILICAGAAAEGPRWREFSEGEIKAMARTKAVIETTLGKIELKFFPEAAPNHVDNFITLAKEGFYDGTAFHRVIPGFMIQGGDPKSKSPNRAGHGTGGPGYTIEAEFNKISHKKGILSMARSSNPDSAGSQFFICVADSPWLDGQYTVFGEVTSGMDVADRIVSQPKDRKDNPIERIEMKVKVIEPAAEEKAPPDEGEVEPAVEEAISEEEKEDEDGGKRDTGVTAD